LIKLSGTKGLHEGIEVEPTQPMLPMLFAPAEGNARDKPTAITTVSQYQLIKEAGMSDGKSGYKLLEQYLTQMSQITVNYRNKIDGWFGSDHLISYHAHEDGRLIIKLNWRLAGAIFGDYLFAEIDLKERRALEKDASKTLHRWLSAHYWKGKPRRHYEYKTLIEHTWTQPASAGAQRLRLLYLKRDILPEIAKLPCWTVETNESGAWITHHKEPKQLL
jgi:hypothetical protein